MAKLLNRKEISSLCVFIFPWPDMEKRPWRNKEEYLGYLEPISGEIFRSLLNSIPDAKGNELFGIFAKKIKH